MVLWLRGSSTFDFKPVFSQWIAISKTKVLAQEQCYDLLMTKTRQSTRYDMVSLGGWQSHIWHCRISNKIALNLLFWWKSYHVCTQWNAKQWPVPPHSKFRLELHALLLYDECNPVPFTHSWLKMRSDCLFAADLSGSVDQTRRRLHRFQLYPESTEKNYSMLNLFLYMCVCI